MNRFWLGLLSIFALILDAMGDQVLYLRADLIDGDRLVTYQVFRPPSIALQALSPPVSGIEVRARHI